MSWPCRAAKSPASLGTWAIGKIAAKCEIIHGNNLVYSNNEKNQNILEYISDVPLYFRMVSYQNYVEFFFLCVYWYMYININVQSIMVNYKANAIFSSTASRGSTIINNKLHMDIWCIYIYNVYLSPSEFGWVVKYDWTILCKLYNGPWTLGCSIKIGCSADATHLDQEWHKTKNNNSFQKSELVKRNSIPSCN